MITCSVQVYLAIDFDCLIQLLSEDVFILSTDPALDPHENSCFGFGSQVLIVSVSTLSIIGDILLNVFRSVF